MDGWSNFEDKYRLFPGYFQKKKKKHLDISGVYPIIRKNLFVVVSTIVKLS